MDTTILTFMNQFGYVAVALLVFLECVFPPIPSEVVLPAAGFLTLSTAMSLPGVVVAATLGAFGGACVFYGVGRLLTRDRLVALVEGRPLRVLGIRAADIDRAIGFFEHKGQLTVLLCRCVPGVRSLISIPAGTARMGAVRFALYTLAGTLVWNIVLCSAGALAGAAWQDASASIGNIADYVTYALAALFVLACAWWFVRRILPAMRARAAR